MTGIRMIALAALIATAAPAAASDQIPAVKSATEYCLKYLETGQRSDVLLKDGFRPKGKAFVRKYPRNLLAGATNDVTVSSKIVHKRRECWISVGNGALREYHNVITQTAKTKGYRSGTHTNKFGRKIATIEKGKTIASITGKATSRSGSISSLIVFSKVN